MTKPSYEELDVAELAKRLVDECSVYGDDPHSGFVGLDHEKVAEILGKWIQAERSEKATRFMVAGGPVVMATDYEAAQLILKSLRAENLRVRGLLQRAKELLRKSINTTSFFDEDVQKQILEFLAGSAETGGEKA